jgi:ABC-type uncharacterized transport system substrate-binding protein
LRSSIICGSSATRRAAISYSIGIFETPEGNAALAAELLALNPDVLLGSGAQQAQALSRATTSIPIVFAWVSDPVGVHIFESLACPRRQRHWNCKL